MHAALLMDVVAATRVIQIKNRASEWPSPCRPLQWMPWQAAALFLPTVFVYMVHQVVQAWASK